MKATTKILKKILSVISGSHLYGTATENSDMDLLDLYLESPEQLLGMEPVKPLPQIQEGNVDIRRFWFKDFLRLVLKGDIVCTEVLFTGPHTPFIREVHPKIRTLLFEMQDAVLNTEGFVRRVLGLANSLKPTSSIKHRYHVARCLEEAKQIITTGFLTWPVKNREFLMDIKSGRETGEEYIKDLMKLCESALQSGNLGQPDKEALNRYLIKLYPSLWKEDAMHEDNL